MNFINDNGKIDLSQVDARDYSGFKGEFIEDIDVHLAQLMLDDNSTFKVPDQEYVEIDGDWVLRQKTDENGVALYVKDETGADKEFPRFAPESKTLLRKRLNLVINNHLKILYHQKKGNIGRYYSSDDLSLTCLARNMRNTLYSYLNWVDYDFVASHPTILTQLAVKLRIPTPRLDEWCKDKKPIVKQLSDYHSVPNQPPLQKDHIKKLVCSALYSGGLETWALGKKQDDGTRKGGIIDGRPEKNEYPIPCRNYEQGKGHTWYKELKVEVKKITKKLVDINPDVKKRVCRADDPEWKKNGSFMSYVLGIFENECLYNAYEYSVNNEIVPARRCNLAYDGFTAPHPPPYTDSVYHLNAVNEYIFEKTGFKMCMEVKGFEEWTIQRDLIEIRRQMVIADVVPPVVVNAVSTDEIAIAEPQVHYDQQYLIWKVKHERTHTKVINTSNFFKKINIPMPNGTEKFEGYKIFSRTDLFNAYEHESYEKTDPDTGKTKRLKYINEWLSDTTINRKEDTKILPPPLYCPHNTLNLWKPSDYFGRDIEPTNEKYDQWAVDLWLNHIGIMCDHDKTTIEYVLNWFAHLLQKPAQKSTHLIITGKQGTGKTIALTPIKKIMGGGYFETSQPERDVWGKFNPLMASSLLVVLSECDKRNAYGSENKIKALITDPEMTINDKGIKPFVIQSFHRFITPTNSFDPVKLEEEERRNMIIKMSDEKKKDWDYFKKFAETWEDDIACLSLYSYLMRRDISEWNRWVIPHTEYHQQLVEFNRNPLDEFLEWFISQIAENQKKNPEVDCTGHITRFGSEVMEEFRKWRDKFGGKYDVNGTGDLIKKITCGLELPKGCIDKGTSSSKGARTKFHLENLKKHYKIGECKLMIPLPNSTTSADDSDSDDTTLEVDEFECVIGEESECEDESEMPPLEEVEPTEFTMKIGDKVVPLKYRK